MKHVDVAIIGRGIAGLSLCRELLRRGGQSLAIVGPSEPIPGSGTIVAQGVCAIKGLVLPKDSLFAAKLASHRFLKKWVIDVAHEAGFPMAYASGSVGEAFNDIQAFQVQLNRAYHRRFTGLFGAEFGFWTDSSTNKYFGVRHPEDFWFDPREALKALEAVVRQASHRVAVVPCLVTNFVATRNGVTEIWSDGTKVLTASKVVVAAGFKSPEIFSKSNISNSFNWSFSQGETFVARTTQAQRFGFLVRGSEPKLFKTTTFIRGTNSLTWRENGELILGSTAMGWSPGAAPGVQDCRNLLSELAMAPSAQLQTTASWQSRWGVRLRVQDRRPVCGPIAGTDNQWWAFTGFYKNGLQLAPFLAPTIAEAIELNDESSIPRGFGTCRF